MSDFDKVERLFTAGPEDLLKIPRVAWNETFSGIHGDDLILIGNRLRELAVDSVRLAAYLNARGGEGGVDLGHDAAVKTQNEQAAKVREALGYQHPYEEIKF
jgi:hypothetical protein